MAVSHLIGHSKNEFSKVSPQMWWNLELDSKYNVLVKSTKYLIWKNNKRGSKLYDGSRKMSKGMMPGGKE
jgi:hypothetical protein